MFVYWRLIYSLAHHKGSPQGFYKTCTWHERQTYKHNPKVSPFGIALVKKKKAIKLGDADVPLTISVCVWKSTVSWWRNVRKVRRKVDRRKEGKKEGRQERRTEGRKRRKNKERRKESKEGIHARFNKPKNQDFSLTMNHSTNHSMGQSVSQPTNQPTNHTAITIRQIQPHTDYLSEDTTTSAWAAVGVRDKEEEKEHWLIDWLID